MSSFKKAFRDYELLDLEIINRTDGNAYKEKLSEEEFNKKFAVKNPAHELPVFYKKTYKDVNESEYELYTLHQILLEQKKTRRSINIIKGILIAFVILSLVASIIIFIEYMINI